MTCCYLECVLFPKEDDRDRNTDEEPLIEYENSIQGKRLRCSVPIPSEAYVRLGRFRRWICEVWAHKRARKCRKITLIIFFLVLLVAFLAIFVGIPVTFMISADWQRSIIFKPRTTPFELKPDLGARLDWTRPYYLGRFQSQTTRNVYVTVNKRENISLGVWQISYVPQNMQEVADSNRSLASGKIPSILYFHRETNDRSAYIDTYTQLFTSFHVITFDYRSYGDSSKAELIEEGMVQDSVELYKWLRTQTSADIYVWGDTLGAAIATHVVARLRNENIVPTGLVLQNPYTTLSDQLVYYWPMSKVFSWLPWYKLTMLDSLERNGFPFKTSEHIVKVDCPIMIISAESNVVPCYFGLELTKIAKENRDPAVQGNVTVNLIPWGEILGNIPGYMRDFIKICEAYDKGRG